MTIDRPDLASAFSSPKRSVDRAAGLTGLLPPPRPRQAIDPAPSDPIQPASEQADADQRPLASPRVATPVKSVRPLQSATKVSVSADVEATTNVAVDLEPDLLERAREHRRVTQATYDEVVVTAFTAVPEQALQRVFAPQRSSQPGTGMPARQRRRRGTAGIQVQLRLSSTQKSWLDEKQRAVDAPSRSALVAAVLRLYLAE